MKEYITNKLKKAFAFGMVAILPLFTACEKDPEPNNNNQPQKHNKILVFDGSGQQIHPDTINYYLNQPDIDSVLMKAQDPQMCCHLEPYAANNVVQFLQTRCDISPRVAGTGPLLFAADAYQSTVNQAKAQGFNAKYINQK